MKSFFSPFIFSRNTKFLSALIQTSNRVRAISVSLVPLLIPVWPETGYGQYSYKHKRSRVELSYQMSDYLHFSMEETRKTMENLWGRPFPEIPLSEVFVESRQGRSIGTLFLIYLYLDQWLKNRYGEQFASPFPEGKLTDEEMNRIQAFFRERSIPYEWDFVEGWKAFFNLRDSFSIPSNREVYLKESFSKFLQAAEGRYREFDFQRAFFIVEVEPFFPLAVSYVREAKSLVLARAREGYPPAQYLQGVIEWRNDQVHSAVQWLEKAYDNHFQRVLCSISLGLILSYMGEFSRAVPYLKEAVYDNHIQFLKPDLLFAYLNLSQMSPAFQTAREIGENYTHFPFEIGLNTMEFLMIALLNGLGVSRDVEQAYIWKERVLYMAAENRIPVNFNEDITAVFTKKLSAFQIKEAKRKAAALYLPAKRYSEMDETDSCARYFH